MSEDRIENVIIVGGGPAGYTAALYAARAELEPLVIEGFQWGGQLQNTTDVENYPGYPQGIMGPEMMSEFREQAERFGTRFITDDVTELKLTDGDVHEVVVGKDTYRARSKDNIEVLTPYRPVAFVAGEDGKIGSLKLEHSETGEEKSLEIGGAFVAIGHTPRSELVVGQVDTDEEGYVEVEEPSTKTKLAGVFAVGDLVDNTYRQAVNAAGTGTKGALDAEWYLRDTPGPDPEAHWGTQTGAIIEAVEASS